MLRVEYERRVRRWTLGEVARQVGLKNNTAPISAMENGSWKPGNDLLDKLCQVFNLWPREILLKHVALIADPEARAKVLEETARLEGGRPREQVGG